MAVGDNESADFIFTLFKIFGIRQNIINARRVLFLELETGVQHDDVIAEFNRRHVLADLFDAAQRNNADTVQPVNMQVLEDPSLFPVLGPSNAKATIIELADYQCPYCTIAAGLASWTEQYKTQYGDLVGSAETAKELANQGKARFIYVSWGRNQYMLQKLHIVRETKENTLKCTTRFLLQVTDLLKTMESTPKQT